MVQTSPPLVPRRVAARILATQAALALVVGLAFLACYAGLQRAPQPRHLPIAVAGQPAAVQAEAALGSRVSITTVLDDAGARQAVTGHDEIAGLALQHGSFRIGGTANLYIAGPNGAAENSAAEQLIDALARRADVRVTVVDLVPTVPFDPRGLASFYVALAATVASFILAQAMFALRQITRLRAQLLTIAGFALVVGSVLAVVAGPVLRVVPVGVFGLAALLTLLSLAVSLTSRALIAWLGPVGITIATLAMTAVGLSTSGGIFGQHLLPSPLGALGAVLPPGSAFRAIVSLGYFDGRHAGVPVAVLAGWAGLGLVALALHHRAVDARISPPPS